MEGTILRNQMYKRIKWQVAIEKEAEIYSFKSDEKNTSKCIKMYHQSDVQETKSRVVQKALGSRRKKRNESAALAQPHNNLFEKINYQRGSL